MPNIEPVIRNRLLSSPGLAAITTAIMPAVADPEMDRPYITYTRIAGEPVNTLAGADSTEHVILQVDAIADTWREAQALATEIRAALDPVAHLQSHFDRNFPPSEGRSRPTYTAALTYSIWFNFEEL